MQFAHCACTLQGKYVRDHTRLDVQPTGRFFLNNMLDGLLVGDVRSSSSCTVMVACMHGCAPWSGHVGHSPSELVHCGMGTHSQHELAGDGSCITHGRTDLERKLCMLHQCPEHMTELNGDGGALSR